MTIQDINTTRFLIAPDEGVSFLVNVMGHMFGGEVFIPKMPSVNIIDAVKIVVPDSKINIVGNWPYEIIHKALLSKEESMYTFEYDEPLHAREREG